MDPKEFAIFSIERGYGVRECVEKYFIHLAYDTFSRERFWPQFIRKYERDRKIIEEIYENKSPLAE